MVQMEAISIEGKKKTMIDTVLRGISTGEDELLGMFYF